MKEPLDSMDVTVKQTVNAAGNGRRRLTGDNSDHKKPMLGAAASVPSLSPDSGGQDHESKTIPHVNSGLQEMEASRASTIGLVLGLICFAVVLWTPFLKGHQVADSLFFSITLGSYSIAGFGMWYRARQPELYTRTLFRLYGLSSVFVAITSLIYLGPFSPTALVITLGISFFGQSGDRTGSWLICGAGVSLTALLLLAVWRGMMTDIGVFRNSAAGSMGMGFMTLMVPLVLLVTHFQARWSRQAVEDAMATAVNAALDVSLKNVQIEEAQAELDRIFGNNGLPGRMTGQTLGQYRLGPLLGRGASGEVYDAVDQIRGTRAALKLLNNHDAEHPAIIARFRREGDIALNINSPYVTTVFGADQTDSGLLYIAMERLEGDDLAALLRRRGKLPVRVVNRMVRHVCEALTTAHDQGVIHRDIKPHNIFYHRESSQRRIWKVLDFGVSKFVSGSATLTQAGCVVGTPRYMSPEQAQGKALDQRSDVYSVGAVIYRAVTGSPPFKRAGYEAIAAAAFQRPVNPRFLAPDLSVQVRAVVSLAMAPDPLQRFSTAEALAVAFDAAYRGSLSAELLQEAELIPWRAPS